MSKDIRSFFQPKKVLKTKVEEDDDVIPESPDVEIKIKKREARKKRILSDSDEEIFSNKKKKSDEHVKHSSQKISKHKNPVKKELKEVKAVDIFGTAPIKRTGPIVKSLEKKIETGIHSDDDFDQSLLELDETNHSLNNTKDVIHSNIKINEEPSATSLNKSADGKSEKNNIPDTEIQRGKKRCHGERNSTKREQPTKTSDSSAGGIHQSPKTTRQNSAILNNSNSDLDMSTTKRKKKLDTSLNETGLTDEERYDRKRQSAALYQKYLNRSGPKHLGTKQIPEGAPNCLKDCAFLLTGVLDSFEREEVAESITRLGGIIKNSISKKVTHVLAGEDAGPAKIAKAQELGIKILNEDKFLELIINNSCAHQTGNVNIKDEKANRNCRQLNDIKKVEKQKDETQKSLAVKIKKEFEKNETDTGMTAQNNNYCGGKQKDPNENNLSIQSECSKLTTNKDFNDLNSVSNKLNTNSLSTMWVEKYKPQNLKQIIGQHGENSNVKKLCNWLTKWYVNRKAKLPKPSPWAKNDDGGYYKAALLSGPPGVGKTTTVTLVCKELGFDMVEFNASDTRNKSLIREQIGELLTTTSLSGYAKGLVGKQAVTKKHVLVMDEVDGMAGNEDRGGLQELIGLIKTASVPIICMCNDRNSQKMRSLVNYCYDLRFNRPRVDQIKAAMMSVCCKEGLKVPGEALAQLAVAANQDVRQTLNLLNLWAADRLRAGAGAGAQTRDAAATIKDVRLIYDFHAIMRKRVASLLRRVRGSANSLLAAVADRADSPIVWHWTQLHASHGPWEAIRKVFSAEDHKTMSIHDKSDLFFHDYSLAPLFVQENYLQVAPHCPKHEVLERLSRAADSISAGDLVDARIRGAQAWNLLPIQAMYSSVIPGHAMSGHITGQIQFPGWLGKNSRRSKMQRLCQEIHAHTRLSTSGSKSSIFLDYCTHLRDAIVTPLVNDKTDGIARSLEVLEAYHLLREDLESLTEMSLWPGQRNPMILIDSKVKAAMTRTYNKTASALPYAPGAVRRARTADAAGLSGDADDDDDGDADDQQHDSDPENDQLIKKRKVKEGEKSSAKKDAPSTSKDKPTSSKGKGKKK